MSLNGSGVMLINSTGQPVAANTLISAAVFNAFTDDVATALSTAVYKDGQQTITANLPMGGFKLTGLAAGSAAGNSVRWEQASAGVLTTTGDTPYASAANTVARMPATANVAAHATTSNIWVAREVILTGAVVTFTDIADAPYAGAVAWVKMNDAHIWTDGEVFNVQGGANYTAAADDWVRVYATTVSTFEVTIFKANGTVVGLIAATQADQETATSTTTYVSPGRQQFHPSAAKAWGYADYASGVPTLRASYNISGIVDNGVGDIDFTISTDMSSGTFSSGGSADDTNLGRYAQTYNNANATYIRVIVTDAAAAAKDPAAVSAWAFGDQA